MIIYQVSVQPSLEIETEWLEWMTRFHIPDVMSTDQFLEFQIFKNTAADESTPEYVIQYTSVSEENLQTYFRDFAPQLQKDHTYRYAGKFQASRKVLVSIQK